MVSVFKNVDDVIVVDAEWIERVKDSARRQPLRRARLNLHRSDDDQVQEMLIAFCRDTLNAPHRHLAKSESLHALEGRALICFFGDDGTVTKRLTIGGPDTGLPPLYRLSSPRWHTVIPLDEIVVVHEVTMGPFRREQDIVPSWMPKGEDALRRFNAMLTPAVIPPGAERHDRETAA